MKDIIIIMFRLIVCIFEIWMLFSFFNIFLKNKYLNVLKINKNNFRD